MVDIAALTPIVIVGLSFLFYKLMMYCKEQLETNRNSSDYKLSNNIFFFILYYVFFHLIILTIPIGINTVWISLVSQETGPATLYNLISLFESLSTLTWFLYSCFIGLFLLFIAIRSLETFKIIGNKEH